MKKLFIILLSCAVGCGGKLTEHSREATEEKSLADLQLQELSNAPVDLRRFKGKVVFVNVWATWCAPCVKEMPTINRVKHELKNENIEFLFASSESREEIEEFVRDTDFDIDFVRLENFEQMGIPALPTTYIFDTDGKLAYSESGFRQWDDSSSVELITRVAADK